MNCHYQIICLVLVICGQSSSEVKLEDAKEIKATVKSWAAELSKQLGCLSSLARRNRTQKSFSKANVKKDNWEKVVQDLAETIRKMMKEKIDAVKEIQKHVQLLSLHRKPPINVNSSYDFYNSDDLWDTSDSFEIEEEEKQKDKMFKCSVPKHYNLRYENQNKCKPPEPTESKDKNKNHYESFRNMDDEYDSFNYKHRRSTKVSNPIEPRCDHIMFIKHSNNNYTKYMKMEYNPHFDTEVNLNHSIIKVTPGVHNRSTKVINGIRMSEALDLTFKCNYQRDPTLTYQYFGSKLGYMRFYPAMQWSDEEYNQTFDFRLRSWYLEGMSSAKDIIILLDRSGSMIGANRNMSIEVVNTILDTLTDNDYVNIYTFTSITESLVDCFDGKLVQANEENLRLLREELVFINDTSVANFTLGLAKALPMLWDYRRKLRGDLECNQAIMIITEGFDYDYETALFDKYNHIPHEKDYKPIRIFTYLIGSEISDAQRLKWIACNNMGYFVNITTHADVREKVLKYLEVMSRPINLSRDIEAQPAWTALYVHLADRRLSNWLWKINVGIKQRQIFMKYRIDEFERVNNVSLPANFSTPKTHDFTKYEEQRGYKYLTSVSLPVYDLRDNKSELLGVAGVDVPLDYIKQLTQPHRIGVNGYPFIITNNGYVLDHPDHRTVFEFEVNKEHKTKILKPTFNRVDFTEVEISDNTTKPRKFDPDIIKLRESIVRQQTNHSRLRVRAPIDDMKRVMLQTRHYYYTSIDPFSLVIALPEGYGFNIIKHTNVTAPTELGESLKRNKFWKIHPKWMYTCSKLHKQHNVPEKELLYFLPYVTKQPRGCNLDLITALLTDVKVTEWFNDDSVFRSFRSPYQDALVLTFLATHAGLTRWKNLVELDESDNATLLKHFANKHNEAADEVYYRRSAEINFEKPDMFLYSVPFGDYDENATLITASNVIFHEHSGYKAPVAAVGFQLYHKVINNILNNFKCKSKSCKISCVDSTWTCYVVDNDGYIILANDTNLVSKSLGEIEPKLMHYLIKDKVFKEITLFDYQDICYENYTSNEKFYGATTIEEVELGRKECEEKERERKEAELKSGRKKTLDYRTKMKCKTIEYLNLRIQKAIPTPCDNELRMYHTLWKSVSIKLTRETINKTCTCPYVTHQIQDTNLMFIAVDGTCCAEEYVEKKSPQEINYSINLPCYIATENNFTKRHYTKCVIRNEKEFAIEKDYKYCGGKGIDPIQ